VEGLRSAAVFFHGGASPSNESRIKTLVEVPRFDGSILDAELLAFLKGLEGAVAMKGFERVFVFSDNQEDLR
jgi:hypothetical protein